MYTCIYGPCDVFNADEIGTYHISEIMSDVEIINIQSLSKC